MAVQQPLLEFRGNAQVVLRLQHPGAQLPGAVLHGVGIKYVRPDEIGIVGLDPPPEQLRVRIPEDVAGQQHAHRLAADAAGADLPFFDVHQVLHGEVFPAQGQPLGFRPQQAAQDVFL